VDEIAGSQQPPGLAQGKPDAPGRVAQPRLWQAARDFQAILLTQMVRAMRQGKTESELFEDSAARAVFDDMLNEAIAARMAEADALRMAELLCRRMGGQLSVQDSTPGRGASGAKKGSTRTIADKR
jgi:Rod binding domain-containing protein